MTERLIIISAPQVAYSDWCRGLGRSWRTTRRPLRWSRWDTADSVKVLVAELKEVLGFQVYFEGGADRISWWIKCGALTEWAVSTDSYGPEQPERQDCHQRMRKTGYNRFGGQTVYCRLFFFNVSISILSFRNLFHRFWLSAEIFEFAFYLLEYSCESHKGFLARGWENPVYESFTKFDVKGECFVLSSSAFGEVRKLKGRGRWHHLMRLLFRASAPNKPFGAHWF